MFKVAINVSNNIVMSNSSNLRKILKKNKWDNRELSDIDVDRPNYKALNNET